MAGNSFVFEIADGHIICPPDLSGVKPITQGQVACWDTSLNSGNGGVRPATVQADLANYVGVAEQNSVLNSLNEQLPTVRIGVKNVYLFNTTAAETYKHGTKVYFNETASDEMTITTNTNTGARTVAVGYVLLHNQDILAGNLSVTGAAGVQVPVAIVPNWPVASIA